MTRTAEPKARPDLAADIPAANRVVPDGVGQRAGAPCRRFVPLIVRGVLLAGWSECAGRMVRRNGTERCDKCGRP